jgi:hypothetical protein
MKRKLDADIDNLNQRVALIDARIDNLVHAMTDLKQIATIHADQISALRNGTQRPVPPKTKKAGWVNIYPGNATSIVWSSRELADNNKEKSRIGCCPIEWEE